MEVALQDFSDTGKKAHMKANLAIEIGLVTNRQRALLAIKEGEAKLTEYLGKFKQVPSDGASSSGSGTGSAQESGVLKVGPCANFEKLQALAAVKKLGSKFLECTSEEEVHTIQEETNATLQVLSEMISSARTSVSQLIKAAASIDAEANKRVKEAALEQKKKLAAAQKMAEASLGHGGKAPRKKQQQGALPTNMIFNHSATSAQLVHVNSVTDSEQNLSTNMDYDKPFVISGLKQLQECFKQDTTFEAEVPAFTTQFTGSSLQAT